MFITALLSKQHYEEIIYLQHGKLAYKISLFICTKARIC